MATLLAIKKLFLVDDGSAETAFLRSSLLEFGYHISSTSDANFDPLALKSSPVDLILVNIKYPFGEVQQTLYWMRCLCKAPIVGMVTADTLLEAGDVHFQIDHIIFKPFELQQIQALIHALPRAINRTTESASNHHSPLDRRKGDRRARVGATQTATAAGVASKLRIDIDARDVYLENKPLGLSPKEYSLFELLASKPGGLVSEDEIIKTLWPRHHGVSDAEIRQYVYRLRRKIERNAVSSDCIQTVKGRGYRFGATTEPD